MHSWTIDFEGMEEKRKVRSAIEQRIAKLAQSYDAVETCRVVVKTPQTGKHKGLYEIDIGLTLADGRDLTIGRSRGTDKRYEDIDFAIDDTFRRARRRLKDLLRDGAGKGRRRKSAAPAASPEPQEEPVAPVRDRDPAATAPADAAESELITGTDKKSKKGKKRGKSALVEVVDAAAEPTVPEPAATEAAPEPAAEPAVVDTAAEPAEPAPVEASAEQAPEPAPVETAAEPAAPEPATTGTAAEPAPVETAAEPAAPEPAATGAAADRTTNVNPFFVAIAVGTALTAAATLNASAAWARLLKEAGRSTQDTDCGKKGETQPGGGEPPVKGD